MDQWQWPVADGTRSLSVVGGQTQDSLAHLQRGSGPAVDLPGYDGQRLQLLVPDAAFSFGLYDPECGYKVDFTWLGERGRWDARYCHLSTYATLMVGQTGTAQGPHVHLALWLNGERVWPEEQLEFRALMESQLKPVFSQQSTQLALIGVGIIFGLLLLRR